MGKIADKFVREVNHKIQLGIIDPVMNLREMADEMESKEKKKKKWLEYNTGLPIDSTRKKEIIEILDRFYSLCNSISDGLPAEIDARQKQYEYYRDQLLSFDNVGVPS